MGRKSSYENGMYQQLMEIMGRLDTIEKEHKKETGELKTEIADLNINSELNAALDTMGIKQCVLLVHSSLPIPITEEKNGT